VRLPISKQTVCWLVIVAATDKNAAAIVVPAVAGGLPSRTQKCGHPADLISNFDQAKAEIGVRERQISSNSIR